MTPGMRIDQAFAMRRMQHAIDRIAYRIRPVGAPRDHLWPNVDDWADEHQSRFMLWDTAA